MISERSRARDSGERRRPACWRLRTLSRVANFSDSKDCFGETPKPTRESRVLPRVMRYVAFGIFVVVPLCCEAAEVIPPKPAGYFADYAHVVSPAAASRFNEQLAQFERETSNQVWVVVY